MTRRWQVFQATSAARYDALSLTNVPLFAEEDFSGCLLGMLPGQVLPRHRHEHEHEAFDVLAGQGSVWLDGEHVTAGIGAIIFVPAGVEHGFENDGDAPWLIRATIHRCTYLRQAVWRAAAKRLWRAK